IGLVSFVLYLHQQSQGTVDLVGRSLNPIHNEAFLCTLDQALAISPAFPAICGAALRASTPIFTSDPPEANPATIPSPVIVFCDSVPAIVPSALNTGSPATSGSAQARSACKINVPCGSFCVIGLSRP